MDNLDNDETLLDGDNSQKAANDAVSQQASKRHSEQMEWAQKEVEKYKNAALDVAVKSVALDAQFLLDLHKQDPDLANDVAKRFNYDSFDDAKKFISPWQKIESKEDVADEDTRFQKMYDTKRWKEKHEEALEMVKQIFSNLPADLKDLAQSQFDELSEWKVLDKEKATKIAQMATLYVSKDALLSDKMSEWVALLASTGIKSNSKPKKEEEPQLVIVDWRLTTILPSNKKN